MDKILKIKDSVFGYISVDDDDVFNVINSPLFHRLQDIIQTSYTSVYPSAVHNRFVHSLGVYHLGKIAADKLQKDIRKKNLLEEDELNRINKTFILACLMHDIGHSPFSHTGEKFYFYFKKNKKTPEVWCDLLKILNDSDFISDSDGSKKWKGAEHEIMSALASLRAFPNVFKELDRSFFARCIVGLKYSDKTNIRNCFIDLLNSRTIDVDKLDYLIRDSFFTGFKTVNIDYERLLTSVCIVNDNNGFSLGFEKTALSTLESVILAHDMERKWIQNHPVIKYEAHLISYMISKSSSDYNSRNKNLFSFEALTEKGLKVRGETICLFSDSNIIVNSKKHLSQDSIIAEYFDRSARRKALWKSESEYKILFGNAGLDDNVLSELENRIKALEDLLLKKYDIPIINDTSLAYLIEEKNGGDGIPEIIMKGKHDELNNSIELVQAIRDYSKKHNIPFEYVICSVSQFNTGFNKKDLQKLKVKFSDSDVRYLDDVLTLFSAKEPRENFFYLYAFPDVRNKIDVSDFTFDLVQFILKKYNKKS